jgi:hypothetical protein
MKLDVWLQQKRTLDERLRIVECLCQAVNEVHDRGQSLAALDPSRVEVGSGGECDLSAARQGSPAPGYQAPDAGGDAPPAMANVYSAGAIAWEILAGRPAGDSPPHLHKVRSDVPRELADAVMACLERSADWRPKDLTYLAQMAAAQQTSAEAPKAAPRAARTARPTPVRAGQRGPARRTWPLLAALVVVIGLAAGAAWQYLGAGLVSSSGAATPPAPPTTVAAAPATTPPAGELPGAEPSPVPAIPAPTMAPVAPAPAPPLTDPGTSSAQTTPARPPVAAPTPTPVPPRPAAPTPTPVPPVREPVTRPEPAAARPNPAPRVQPPPVNSEPQTAPPALPAQVAPPAPPPEVAPPAPPAEPVVLTAVSPLEVRRPGNVLLDLRGSGFRADLRAVILPLTKAPRGIAVMRQKFVNPTLITVLVELAENAETGEFAIAVEDASGARSEHAVFRVTK